MTRYNIHTGSLALLLLALPTLAKAQEVVSPLTVIPRPGNLPPAHKAGEPNSIFLYQNDPQTLPVIDDFSVDRTRHRNARPDDSDVEQTATIYRIEVAGQSTADMAFQADTTFHYTVEITDDTLIIHVEPNPSVVAIVRDLQQWPVEENSMRLWPPYTILDTLGGGPPDTLALQPTILQDSLLVFEVEPDPRVYINPDNSPRPWILWEDDDAYVNNSFPIDPPSIGVATLDGMDRTGYPYDPANPNVNGPADKLTSVPINLAFPPSDSIYLSFFCQPIGLSGDDLAHAEDSLYVDLFAPMEQKWYPVWSAPGTAPSDRFSQVMIPITQERYLKQGFKMRFRNDATLGGMVDQWHIDYVRLDRNRAATDTVLQDVAWVYQQKGLLQSYTAVPYAKFIQAPASYMASEVELAQRNNDTDDKFITWGYQVDTDCGWSASRSGYGNNISNNAYSTFATPHPVNSGTDPLVYDLDGCNDAAFVDIKFWTNATPDACAYNDTMHVVQEISNFYSYDDGSAEAGYSLTNAGSKLAYRFDTQGADSLRAVRAYFAPIFTYNAPPDNYPPDGVFILTVWKNLDPEEIIFQNISFSKPEYKGWGPDHFVEYELDSTIAVEGTFYVGWVQTNATMMNLGLDRNRNNSDKMFYSTGLTWSQTGHQGSWMIRPVMVAAADPFAGVGEQDGVDPLMRVFPNPATTAFQLSGEGVPGARLLLIDPMGRLVRRWEAAEGSYDLQGIAPGAYIVRLQDRAGRPIAHERLIVQRP